MATKADVPVTRCGACGQEDDHPKHQISVGFNNPDTNNEMFHKHDFAEWTTDADGNEVLRQNGVIYYHFDCPSEWHDLHAKWGVHEDPEAHAEGLRRADHHAAIVAACRGGLKGAKLRDAIMNGEI